MLDTPGNPFQPNEAQRRLLHHIYENPVIGTIGSLCHHAQIPRSTYYNWCRNPQFRQWFATAWSSRLIVDGTTLLNTARLHSHRSYPHWKALFDLTFTPKGLSQLHHWRDTCAAARSDAFDVPGLEPDPEGQRTSGPGPVGAPTATNTGNPQPPPSGRPHVSKCPGPQAESNQRRDPGGWTKPPREPENTATHPSAHRAPRFSRRAGAPGSPLPHHLPRLITRCLAIHPKRDHSSRAEKPARTRKTPATDWPTAPGAL